MPSPRPGTNSSQMPLGMCLRIGWRRPSQSLKSPMTLTPVALGAQTAKFTPSTPSIGAQLRTQLVVALPVLAFAEQVQVVIRSAAAERRRDRAWSIARRAGRQRAADTGVSGRRLERGKWLRTSPAGWIRRIGCDRLWAGWTTQACCRFGQERPHRQRARPAGIDDLVRSEDFERVFVSGLRPGPVPYPAQH